MIVSAIAAGILAYPIYKMLLAMKSRQIVSAHVEEHLAKQGTPTMGGMILLAGLLAGSYFDKTALLHMPLVIGFALMGFLDDYVVPKMMPGKRGLGWKQKITAQLVVATLCALPLGFSFGAWQQLALFVFIVLFFSNAYNFADGMDGLAASILVLFSIGLLCLFGKNSDAAGAVLACCLVGATGPFLALNAPKARVFMGDVGALPIGALLGAMVVRAAGYGMPETVGTGIFSILLIIELVMVPMQVASVKIRKKKLFLMTPVHHAFQKMGYEETRIVAGFALFQAGCVAAGLWLAFVGMAKG